MKDLPVPPTSADMSASPRPFEPDAADGDRDPLETLADEFMEQLRAGAHPSIDDYVERAPELAEQIRDLFPTIVQLECAKKRNDDPTPRRRESLLGLERLGDFVIIREIGRGGMGIVYECQQESLGRRVAVKVLPKQALLDQKHLARFQREARAAARLHHTNIVPVLGVGQQEGYHYYVMQLIRGVGLDEIIHSLKSWTGSDRSGSPGPIPNPGKESRASHVARGLLAGDFSSVDTDITTVVSAGQETTDQKQATAIHADPASLQESSHSRPTLNGEHPVTPRSHGDEPTSLAGMPLSAARLTPNYWRSIARIGYQIADALDYAHAQGTLHRDIKPANLLLDTKGVAWIADFGLAKAFEHEDVSQTGDIVGTLRFMAPEQLQGRYDQRSDVYSLGLSLYELLTLQQAYNDATRKKTLLSPQSPVEPLRPRRINPDIPRDLETIVVKATMTEPEHRYQSAAELREDLLCFLEDRPIRARRASAWERSWRWCRRNRLTALLAATAILSLILVATMASVGYVLGRIAHHKVSHALEKEREILETSLSALERVVQRLAPDGGLIVTDVAMDDNVDGAMHDGANDGGANDGGAIEVAEYPILTRANAEILADILKVYDRFAEHGSHDVRLQEETAKANRRVADIEYRLGEFDKAAAAYQRAIHLYQQLEQESPTSRFGVEIARTYNQLGILYASTSTWRERHRHIESHRQALHILESPTVEKQVDNASRFELARTHYYLGRSPFGERGGRPPRNRRHPDRSADRDGEHPLPPPPDRLPADAPGRFADNALHINEAIEILSQLRQHDEKNAEYRLLLALCYRERRASAADQEDRRLAVEMLESLHKEFPSVPNYTYELIRTYTRAARPGRGPHDRELAPDHLVRAAQLAQELVKNHPHIPLYEAARLDAEQDRALHALRHKGDPSGLSDDDALKLLRTIHDERSALVKRYPKATNFFFGQIRLRFELVRYYVESKRYAELEALTQQSISEAEAILQEQEQSAASPPDKQFLHAGLAYMYDKLVYALENQPNPDAARIEQVRQRAARYEKFRRPRQPDRPYL